MESIDSWIVDEETMPTLSHMMETGINFTNRYSPFSMGGRRLIQNLLVIPVCML